MQDGWICKMEEDNNRNSEIMDEVLGRMSDKKARTVWQKPRLRLEEEAIFGLVLT